MAYTKKSRNQPVDIEDLYDFRIKAVWRGFWQENMAFWALCAYFFFEYVRPQQIYPVIDVVPWAQLSLLATLVAAYTDKSIQWVENVENKLLLSFVFIVALSGFFAFLPVYSIRAWTLMFNWVLIYFLVINIVNTEKRFYLFILAFLIFSFKMSQHGFFSWAGRGFSFTSWGLIGAGGWFQNSGEFAIQMLIFSTLSAAFVIALKDRWKGIKKWFFYFMPFTGLMTIMGASSRGAQLALGVIGVVMIFRSKARFKGLVYLVLIGSFLYMVLPDEQIARFSDIGSDANSKSRIAYWEYGMQVIRDNPLLGIGYKNWYGYSAFVKPEGIYNGRIQLSHNIFIEAGAELGLLGLASFLLMAIFIFVVNSRTRKLATKTGNQFFYYISHGLDYGLIGYLVAGFFVTVLYYPFFWVQMAITVALHQIAKSQASKLPQGVVTEESGDEQLHPSHLRNL